MIYILLAVVVLVGIYLFLLKGRTGQPGLEELRRWSYAHRGLHGEGVPENSMAAFRAALDAGYGIELDVHLLSDGGLAVMHDSALSRTTGREGTIEELTLDRLKDYHLEGTEETIPEFGQVLELFAGKAPLIIELKPENNNCDRLAEAVCRAMEGYSGPYCMESFHPGCLVWLKKHRPDIIRGQLAENFLAVKGGPVPWIVKLAMTEHLANVATRPDFVAYRYCDRNRFGTRICRRLWGLQGVSWTLRSQQEYDTAVADGWLPIFEGFRPKVGTRV